MSKTRHFPPPWTVRKTDGGHYAVVDANNTDIAYIYVQVERSVWGSGLTNREAQTIAANIARLPELLRAAPEQSDRAG